MQQIELFGSLRPPSGTESESAVTQACGTRARSLKIEAEGDAWKGKIKPKIRLKGYWLASAGFKPGERTQVKFISPGVIELRSPQV